MSKRVLFNGAVLVRPGAATKIDASQFENVALGGLGSVALIGSADQGTPRTVKVFTTAAAVKTEYASGNLVEAAAIVSDPGNDNRIPAGAQSIICYMVNNATKSTLTKNAHVMSSRGYGLRQNSITAAAAEAAPTISSNSTGVGANTLTDALQAMGINAYIGYWLISSAGVVYYVVSNDGTSFTLAAGGAVPAAGAYKLFPQHAYARIFTFQALDADGILITETSPTIGGTGKFTMRYTGAGATCPVTVDATHLVTVTGVPADNLDLTWASYPTLDLLIRAIDAHPSYTASALITGDVGFASANLDAVTCLDCKPISHPIMATNFDIGDWINTNSAYVADVVTLATAGLVTVFTATTGGFTGGGAGTADTANWTTGLAAIAGVRCNQVVCLASTNADVKYGGVAGGTELAAVLAGLTAHCKLMSGTAGRSERQGWMGVYKSKTDLISYANIQNSEHVCLCGQKITRPRSTDGAVTSMSEWALACALAGMRAGAPFGEPLTWKYVNCSAITQDVSWSPSSTADVSDLILNGVIVVTEVRGKGFRIEKGITTYTRTDNDAYTEETIVQIWKNVSYDLRTALEDRYTGRPATLTTVKSVPALVATVLEKHKQAGSLTESVVAGTVVPAYRNTVVSLSGDQMTVGVVITPTPGINFILNTNVLIPATMSF